MSSTSIFNYCTSYIIIVNLNLTRFINLALDLTVVQWTRSKEMALSEKNSKKERKKLKNKKQLRKKIYVFAVIKLVCVTINLRALLS